MILTSLDVTPDELARRTGWSIEPEGACKGDVCVPLPEPVQTDGHVDVRRLAEQLRMPLVHDEAHGLWCVGPESGGRALTTAVASELELPDLDGNPFALSSLRGRKVLLLAWASW